MNRFQVGLGVAVWLLFLLNWHPQMQEPRWIVVLLLFSPLVLMPLSRDLWCPRGRYHAVLEGVSAFLLVAAFMQPPGWPAALAASGWLMVRSATALGVLMDWRQQWPRDLAEVSLACARLFPAIGAAWLVADRAGWQPFGFDALMVLLTAAHFHHAGFTLPLMAGLLGKAKPGCLARFTGLLILIGVPLVAAGITCTHFDTGRWVEPLAAFVLVSGSLGVAALQMSRAGDLIGRPWLRAGFLLSGASLACAMLLAAGYGLRSLWPGGALPMPAMWAVHGTLNTFGFGFIGILSWQALFARTADS